MKFNLSDDNRHKFSQVRLPVDPKREGGGRRINGIAVEAGGSFGHSVLQRAHERARWVNWTLMEAGEEGGLRRHRHLGRRLHNL